MRPRIGGPFALVILCVLTFPGNVRAQSSLRIDGETPENRRILSNVASLFNAGKTEESAGRLDAALALYASALTIVRGVSKPSTGIGIFEATALEVIGDLHRQRANWSVAYAYYDSATVRLEVMRKTLTARDKLNLASFLAPLYQRWILTTLARSRELGADAAAAAALAIADRGRSRELRDMRATHALAGRTSGWVLSFSAGMDMARDGRALAAHLDTMRLPALYYQVTNDTLLTWSMPGEGKIQINRFRVRRDTLNALAERFQRALRSAPGGASTDRESAGWLLGRILLPADLAERVPPGELLILPDAGLSGIPFAALRLPSGELLGERYAIRYMQGLANLTDIRLATYDLAAPNPRVLVAGNPTMPRSTVGGQTVAWEPLRFSEAEALMIADRFNAQALIGVTATEARIMGELGNAALIHLATHGEAFDSEAETENSYLVLAEGEGADGILRIKDILERGPPLRAEIVVLSACRTAVGNLREAEGTMGFQRAFIAKGAGSVLVSLWSVQDRTTMMLMDRFYQELLTNRVGKAEALRRAQAYIRATPGRDHPYYWAAFQLFEARRSPVTAARASPTQP